MNTPFLPKTKTAENNQIAPFSAPKTKKKFRLASNVYSINRRGPSTLICDTVNTMLQSYELRKQQQKYIHFTLTQVKDSAKIPHYVNIQSCLSGNWLIFTDETQTGRILITHVSLVLIFSVSLQFQFKLVDNNKATSEFMTWLGNYAGHRARL